MSACSENKVFIWQTSEAENDIIRVTTTWQRTVASTASGRPNLLYYCITGRRGRWTACYMHSKYSWCTILRSKRGRIVLAACSCRYKTEGVLEAAPETVFHFIDPTTEDSPRNEWDKSITQRDILSQLHDVRVGTTW